MDSLVGKWKGSANDVTGVDEFLAALGKPELKAHLETDHYLEYSRSGNTFTVAVTSQGSTQSTVVVVGTDQEIMIPFYGKAKAKTTFEGNALVSRGIVDGADIVLKNYVEGGVLVQENSMKGKTLISRATKV